jgi:hypothetical protein
LNVDGEVVAIDMLCSDIRGIYVPSLVAGKALGDCPNGHSRSCATVIKKAVRMDVNAVRESLYDCVLASLCQSKILSF